MSRRTPTPILPLLTDDVVRRFWMSVTPTPGQSGCWLWTGNIRRGDHSAGYGRFSIAGKLVSAHRFAWVATHGREVPDGLELDHLCRNRACVNPAHLEVVTYAENVHRSNNPAGRNSRKTHCKRGHPFDEENTYWRPDGRGRSCNACNTLRQARLREARRTA